MRKATSLATVTLGLCSGLIVGGCVGFKAGEILQEGNEKQNERYARLCSYNELLVQLILNSAQGKGISEELRRRCVTCVAIYGCGSLGRVLVSQLKDTEVEITCFIDANTNDHKNVEGIPVVSVEEAAQNDTSETIIVTPIFDYTSIIEKLNTIGMKKRIISFEELVYVYE